MSEFETWETAVAAGMGVPKYTSAMTRKAPDDGAVAARYRISHNVWDGPNLGDEDLRPMGYYTIRPEYPPEGL